MPYRLPSRLHKKVIRRVRRKRTYTRKARMTRVPRTPLIISDRKLVRMRYSDIITLNPAAAGVSDNHFYRANSLFDPALTGVGHQPLSFDQYMAFYNHFTVVGARITLKFIANTAVAANTCIVGCYLDDDSTVLADPTLLIEQGKTSYKIMSSIDGSNSVVTLRKGFSAKKFFGHGNLVGESQYQGTVAGNPEEEALFHIFAAASNAGDAAAFNVLVVIDYVAILTERSTLPQS